MSEQRREISHLSVLQQNPKRFKRIKFLDALFAAEGHELRIAGGAVRDILLGKQPEDIDFATTSLPQQSLKIVKKHEDLLRIIVTETGLHHGTVAVKFKDVEFDLKRIKLISQGNDDTNNDSCTKKEADPKYDNEEPYEITTLRCDEFTDGRHAEVSFVKDWRTDAERRDLTINAMFLTIDEGKLIDYFGGESDLKNGIVRFVGDADLRIKEDYLRILRYFRFWTRYGRSNPPDTDSLAKMISNMDGLNKISGERIWQELKKTFRHLPCVEAIKFMLKVRLFDCTGLTDCESTRDYELFCKRALEEAKIVQDNITRYFKIYAEEPSSLSNQNLSNEKTKLEALLPVLIFSSLVQSNEHCLNAYNRLHMSNLERDVILYKLKNEPSALTVEALKYQLAMARPIDRPPALLKIKCCLIAKGLFSTIDELNAMVIPEFPLNGRHVSNLMKKKKLHPKFTKNIIELVKSDWIKSNYSLNSDDLICKVDERTDELMKKNNS